MQRLIDNILHCSPGSPRPRRAIARAWPAALVLAAALSLAADGVRAADPPTLEIQVKSAFVLNFVQFVDWPDGTFKTPDQPIIIGVLGADAFQAALSAAAEGKTIKGRKLIVRAFSPSPNGDSLPWHVVVLGAGAGAKPAELLKALGPAPVLTVGESEDFTASGGLIRFYLEDRKVRFEINVGAAGRARIQISAKLLKLAKVVDQ
jgi:hypothetical protein